MVYRLHDCSYIAIELENNEVVGKIKVLILCLSSSVQAVSTRVSPFRVFGPYLVHNQEYRNGISWIPNGIGGLVMYGFDVWGARNVEMHHQAKGRNDRITHCWVQTVPHIPHTTPIFAGLHLGGSNDLFSPTLPPVPFRKSVRPDGCE